MRALKRRFATLDAMRGFAAFTVLLYHVDQGFFETSCLAADNCEVRFGYLAVDMFFALSGFVLGFSYDRAFADALDWRRFMRQRVVRLAPIYWVGVAIGAVPILLDWRDGAALTSTAKILIFNALLLPSPTFYTHIEPFPVSTPAWSLFLELWVANPIFALLGPKLRGKVLLGLIVAGVLGLVGSLLWYGTLNVGFFWSNFAGGFARVLYSFFAGIAVQRFRKKRPAPAVPAFFICLLLLLSFIPHVPFALSPAYELTCVLVLYPALIYLGSSAIEQRPRLGRMLGDASFSLYVVHIPMMSIMIRYMRNHSIPSTWELATAFVVVVLAVALLVDSTYDPIARRLLGRALKMG